jgi:hypothetical protein
VCRQQEALEADREVGPRQGRYHVAEDTTEVLRRLTRQLARQVVHRHDDRADDINVSLAFTIDGKIFGKADFARTTFQWKFPEGSPYGAMIYLMSDLVLPSAAPRLSKLVLLCLLSSDVKRKR